jgi:hypothetical protein
MDANNQWRHMAMIIGLQAAAAAAHVYANNKRKTRSFMFARAGGYKAIFMLVPSLVVD